MFKITIQYAGPSKTFSVPKDHYKTCEGKSIVECLSKFALEVAQLMETLHEERINDLRFRDIDNSDVPF